MSTPEFLSAIRALALEYNMLPEGKRVLCAVSGGADSMALLHALGALREERSFSLTAAHFNHRLRGAQSERDADFVQSYCRARGIPLESGAGDVGAEAARQGLGIEETARQMRYAFLEDAAKRCGAARIVTAHHADDNLETLLLRLLRGSGLRGLSGIPPVRGLIARPMLTLSRAQIERYLTEHAIPFVEDESNADTAYLRNYLRHDIIPRLRARSPALTEHSVRSIRSLREDQSFLLARAAELYRSAQPAEEGLVIPAALIAKRPKALSARLIWLLLEGIEAPPPDFRHIEAIYALAQSDDPSASLRLPGGVLVQRLYGELLFAWTWEQEPLPPLAPCAVQIGGVTRPEGALWQLHCSESTCPESPAPDTFYLAAAQRAGTLLLRARAQGDLLALPGRHSKSLKKWMIEEKIPRRIRERVPVLADDLGVLAAAGLGPDRNRLAQAGEPALACRFEALQGEP